MEEALSVYQGIIKRVVEMPGYYKIEQLVIEIHDSWTVTTVYRKDRFSKGQMVYVIPKGFVLPTRILDQIPDDYRLDDKFRVTLQSWKGFKSNAIVFPLNNPACTSLYREADKLRSELSPIKLKPIDTLLEYTTNVNRITKVDYTPALDVTAEDLGIVKN